MPIKVIVLRPLPWALPPGLLAPVDSRQWPPTPADVPLWEGYLQVEWPPARRKAPGRGRGRVPGKERIADELRVLAALARAPMLHIDTIERQLGLKCTRRSLEMMLATRRRHGCIHTGQCPNGHYAPRTRLVALAPDGRERLLRHLAGDGRAESWLGKHVDLMQPPPSLRLRKQSVVDRLLPGSVLLHLAETHPALVAEWQATRSIGHAPPDGWIVPPDGLPLNDGRVLLTGDDALKPRRAGAFTATAEMWIRDPAGPNHRLLIVPLPAGRRAEHTALIRAADHCITGWAAANPLYQRVGTPPIVLFIANEDDLPAAIDRADRTITGNHRHPATRQTNWPGRERILFTTHPQLLGQRYIRRLPEEPPDYRQDNDGRIPTRTHPTAACTLFTGSPTPDLRIRESHLPPYKRRPAKPAAADQGEVAQQRTTQPQASTEPRTPVAPKNSEPANTGTHTERTNTADPANPSEATTAHTGPNTPAAHGAQSRPQTEATVPGTGRSRNTEATQSQATTRPKTSEADTNDDGTLPFDWDSLPKIEKPPRSRRRRRAAT